MNDKTNDEKYNMDMQTKISDQISKIGIVIWNRNENETEVMIIQITICKFKDKSML